MDEGIRKMIRILTTLYNSERYIGMTIQSLKNQNNKNWKCYITADLPTDSSIQVARENIQNDDRFEIIENTEKQWQTGNYKQVMDRPEIDNEDICITLDGDDWLPDEETLTRIESYYEDKKTWITYGQFVYFEGEGKYKNGFAKPPITGIAGQRQTKSY